MSASNKKKLRKEQNAAVMTEKQLKEKKEAKKLKISSVIFAVIMVIVLIIGLTVMVIRGVQGSGIIEKNTTALTVSDHKLNSIVMNYYYMDTVTSAYDEWYSMYGDYTASYLSMIQLDVTKPLDEQTYYEGDTTWADYFMQLATDRAIADYAVYDVAMAENYTLSAEDELNLDSAVNYKNLYAMSGGYSDVDDYMVALYGPGSSRDSYYEYKKVSAIASAYYNDFGDTLEYTADELRAHEEGNEINYNSYTYASYYLGYNKFIGEGVTSPSNEQIEAAAAIAKGEAAALISATTIEELDEAIANLPVNAETTAASTKNKNVLYSSVNSVIRDWVADPARVENEITMIANEVTSTDDAGNETTTINGYYVVMFQSANDNNEPMANVRHLLIKPEETTDEEGNTIITDDAKAAAKAEAEGHLDTWKQGEATEESFSELVVKYSLDSSSVDGGLFEDIHPGSSYVENFLNWAIDTDRKTGDTDVIETEHGYHVMYYVGDDELSYRDYMITNELLDADLEAWYNNIVDAVTVVEGDLSRIKTGLILAQ